MTDAEPPRPPTQPQLVAWSLVSLIGTMMLLPLNALIPAFYAKNAAVSLAQIGSIFLVARLYDAVADPTIGYLSDRTRGPLGRRKPWMLAGAVLASLFGWLLFNPPATAGFAYLLPVVLVFYTAYSMLTVPHSAWGSELCRGYEQRSFVSGLLTFSGVSGLLIFMGLPVLLSSPLIPLFKTAELTPPMLKLLGWLLVIGAPLCILPSVLFTPRGQVDERQAKVRFKDLWPSLRVNRPFWWFVAAYMMSSLGYGVYYGTTYLFVDGYMGLADKFPLIYSAAAIGQMLSIPIWTRLCQKFERHHIWAIGIGAYGLLLPLRLLIPHGPLAFPLLMALTAVASFANAASQVPQMAVLADCIDYATLKTGKNLAGSYYALQQFTLKASLAVGGAVAFWALGFTHYDAKATVHAAGSLKGLAAVHTVGPLILYGGAALLLWFFPISRARQASLRQDLDARAAAAVAT